MRYLAAFIVLLVGQLPLSAELVGVVNGSTGSVRLLRGGQVFQPTAGSGLETGDGLTIPDRGGLSYRTKAGDYLVVGAPSTLDLADGKVVITRGIVRAVVRHTLDIQLAKHRLQADRGVFEISTLDGTAAISVAAGGGKLTLSDQTTYALVAGEMVKIDAEGNLTVVQRDPRLTQRLQEIMLTIAGATSRSLRGTQLNSVAQSEQISSQNDYTLDFDADENSNQQFASSNNQDQQTQDTINRSQDAVTIAGSPTLNLPSVGSSPGQPGSPGGSADAARFSTVDVNGTQVLGSAHFITAEQVANLNIQLRADEVAGLNSGESRFWSIGRSDPNLPNEWMTKSNFDIKAGTQTIREAQNVFLVPSTNLVLVDFGDNRGPNANGFPSSFDPADPRIDLIDPNNTQELNPVAPVIDAIFIKVAGNDPLDANEVTGFSPVQVGDSQDGDDRFKESGNQFINPLLTYVFGNFRFTDTADGLEISTRRSDQDRTVPIDNTGSPTFGAGTPREGVSFTKDTNGFSVPSSFSDKPTRIRDLPRDIRAALTVATAESLKGFAQRTNQTRFVVDGKIIDITGYKR